MISKKQKHVGITQINNIMEDEYYIDITEEELEELSSVSEFRRFFNTLTEMHELTDLTNLKQYLLDVGRNECYLIVQQYENR